MFLCYKNLIKCSYLLRCLQTYLAHEGFVRGITMSPLSNDFFSCGNDKIIKHWKYDLETSTNKLEPIQTIIGKTFYTSIDHHYKKPVYATTGECVNIWDEGHSQPIKSNLTLNEKLVIYFKNCFFLIFFQTQRLFLGC